MKQFPYLGQHATVILLRVVVCIIFIAHAVVRIANSTIDQFADFLNSKGLVYGYALVWVLTVFEVAGGLLLAVGLFRRVLSFIFILILLAGIFLIHAQLGWFVGEHGTGGMEYSVVLIAALLVIAATPHHHRHHHSKHGKGTAS
ncbi:MAG: DoxX family protein [Ferruginibacter sp.]